MLQSVARSMVTKRMFRTTQRRLTSSDAAAITPKKSWWTSAEWWGGMGALAGWGMTGVR